MHEPVSDIIPCVGPRGLLMNESDEDAVWAYTGTAHGKHLIYLYLLPKHGSSHSQVPSTLCLVPTKLPDWTVTSLLTGSGGSLRTVWSNSTHLTLRTSESLATSTGTKSDGEIYKMLVLIQIDTDSRRSKNAHKIQYSTPTSVTVMGTP
jgi:hypothetical protein